MAEPPAPKDVKALAKPPSPKVVEAVAKPPAPRLQIVKAVEKPPTPKSSEVLSLAEFLSIPAVHPQTGTGVEGALWLLDDQGRKNKRI